MGLKNSKVKKLEAVNSIAIQSRSLPLCTNFGELSMDTKLYYEDDASLMPIRSSKVAIIGFGNQGHAHALNLHNSEVPLCVGLRKGSPSWEKAKAQGLEVKTIEDAAKWADVIMLLIPDESMAAVYQESIEMHLKPGKHLAFAHGLNIHYKVIEPPEHTCVFLVAPKGPGRLLRTQFLEGKGLPCLIAMHKENKSTFDLALSYAKAIGGTKAGVFQTSFREETETDLFGEQTILCGGIPELIKAGFETLVEQGYDPVMAYFECLHESKLIVDLLYEGGLSKMRDSISNTAEFGGYQAGAKIIGAEAKREMTKTLEEIKSGQFTRQWLKEAKENSPNLLEKRSKEKKLLIERVGSFLRKNFKF